MSITHFLAGSSGEWVIERLDTVTGSSLPVATHLAVRVEHAPDPTTSARWLLRGVPSYERYVVRAEKTALEARQARLGRPEASCAALIPIAKAERWWALAQDERRAIFETRSHHIELGAHYLPAIARRLYQSRDLGEPFDFLTWFEYAPADADAFEELVQRLRQTEEWQYVEREIDIRLRRAAG